MRQKSKYFYLACVWVWLILEVIVADPVINHPVQAPKILFINSYHYGYRQSDDINRTVFHNLQKQISGIDIRLEYMDTKRYNKNSDFNRFSDFLSQKYQKDNFDLIITSDDYAFKFIQQMQKTRWSDLPVVFCGLNHFEPEMLSGYPKYTGIVERSDIEDNIRLIEKLHPDAKTLYIINDNSLTGMAIKVGEGDVIKKISRLKVKYLEGNQLSLEELLNQLNHLPPDAVVLYQLWLRDKTQRIYTHEEVLPLISINSSVPVYGFSEIYLGYGIVGGKLISGIEQGKVVVDMTQRILSGTEPKDIPVQMDSHYVYKFDYRQMKRFGISEKMLPPESQFIERPESFYEKHRNIILIALVVLLIETALIVYLLMNRRWRIKVEAALRSEHQLLSALMDNMPDLIYFKDKYSRFIQNNKAHLKLFGLTNQEEMLGKTNFDFFPLDFAEETLEDEKKIIETGEPLVNKIENISDVKGKPTWVSTTKVPVKDESGEVITIIGISRDITERMISAEKIQASLEDKELLLKEIHHRVKNNLQVISSLLNLQSSYNKDPEILSVLKQSQHRVRSMALIHENLYKSTDISHLDLQDYVKTLVHGLKRSYQSGPKSVRFELYVDDIPLGIDRAVPCGLIINELVSNALKHAFSKETSDPLIKTHFTMNNSNEVFLQIQDNGKGMPDNFDWAKINSLGLKLVRILAEDQLDGQIKFQNNNGTLIEIRFKLDVKTPA